MTNLVIVESPGKTEKIKSYLGVGWEVQASFGHIRDLPEKEMGFSAPDFQPHYVETERGAHTVKRLKRLAEQADAVYLATDADREGESIAWHLQQALNLKNPLRITFTEINETAVKQAVAHPRSIDMRLVAAQELRRLLDRDVGYTVSSALSKQASQTLSAGRVQSPAVRLVVERERAIRDFRSTPHYGAELTFGEVTPWKAQWNIKPLLVNGDEYMLYRDVALAVSKVTEVQVSEFTAATIRRRPPPAPFITSTLQQAASVRLRFDPEYTMKLAQKLYEGGLGNEGAITYMRADNPNLSAPALEALAQEAGRRGLPIVEQPRIWVAKNGAQMAHEAIRPTHFDIEVAGTTDDEKALYRLIWQRAMASQLADALYTVRSATLTGVVADKIVEFTATGRTLTSAGWLELLDRDDTEDKKKEEDEVSNAVPELTVGAVLRPTAGKLVTKKTCAPARFTKASLIKKLEEEGIGRPSTYASILRNIEDRAYVLEKSRQLYATELGELVTDGLVGHFSFIDLDFTRAVEDTLDLVVHGAAAYTSTIRDFHSRLESELQRYCQVAAVAPAHPCPDCGKALQRIARKDTGHFWGCSAYPACKCTLPDKGDAPGERKAQTVYNCGACGSPLAHRKSGARPGKHAYNFWSCSTYPQCTESYPDNNGVPKGF